MTLAVEIASATVAGVVTVMLSAMVERLGPVIGGVLGCVPHVAVVGSIGFLLQTASSDEFRIAMLSMPLGMLCNGFLFLGVRLASFLPICEGKTPTGRLTLCLACGAVCYAAGLIAIIMGLRPKERSMQIAWLAAVAAFVLEFLVGLVLMYLTPSSSHATKQHSSCKVLMARGVPPFCVVFLAMVLARSSPALAGIVANLPMVSGMAIIILWMGQGEEVAIGSMGPMAIGLLSPAAYSMISSELMLLWHPALGCVVSWFLSLAVITKPSLMILQRLDQKHKEHNTVEYDSAKARSETEVSSEGSSNSC